MATRKVILAETCPVCCRPAHSPFRSRDERGAIVLGCVDHFHTGHIAAPSASAEWHTRPDAKRIRAAAKAGRDGWVTERAA